MKRFAGWHLLVCVAIVLALRLLISQSRQEGQTARHFSEEVWKVW